MMGLNNWLHWLAWFVKYFVFILISVAVETVFFVINTGENGSVMSYISPTVLLMFLIAYAVATITFCFAASTFFSRGMSSCCGITVNHKLTVRPSIQAIGQSIL